MNEITTKKALGKINQFFPKCASVNLLFVVSDNTTLLSANMHKLAKVEKENKLVKIMKNKWQEKQIMANRTRLSEPR